MESFLKRNHMSNRVCTAQRRHEIDQTEVDAFHTLINEALNDPSDKIILNADESHWKVLMPPKRSIAFTGQDSVKLDIDGDRKAGFTILATISSDGDKYPLVMIARGKTKACHKQLGVHPKHEYKVVNTDSGWISETVFIEYLTWIHSIVRKEKIYLVMDQYGAHFGPSADAKAKSLNIKLIPVPKGGTSIYQPLDRGIFGIMKRMGKPNGRKCRIRIPKGNGTNKRLQPSLLIAGTQSKQATSSQHGILTDTSSTLNQQVTILIRNSVQH